MLKMAVDTRNPSGGPFERSVHGASRTHKTELDDGVAEAQDHDGDAKDRERVFPRDAGQYPEAEDDQADKDCCREVRRHDRQHDHSRDDKGAVEIFLFVRFGTNTR